MKIGFYNFYKMTNEQKESFEKMIGKLITCVLEGRSTAYTATQTNLNISEVEYNIDELLYTLRNHVGKWRFFKILFTK